MLKEASKILEIIMEFCRENTNMVIIAGAALIVVIILAIIAALVKEPKAIDEVASDEATKQPREDRVPEVVHIEQPPKTPTIEVLEEELIQVVAKEEPVEEVAKEELDNKVIKNDPVVAVAEEKRQQSFSKNTMNLGDIVEGLAELSGSGVKNIEIKIPGAEVKITYTDNEEKKSFDHIDDNADIEDLEEKSRIVEGINPEEKESYSDKAPAIKKFGPNNMNVSRSGKVFSEEELQMQIRD